MTARSPRLSTTPWHRKSDLFPRPAPWNPSPPSLNPQHSTLNPYTLARANHSPMQLLNKTTRTQDVARQLATIGPRLGKTLRHQVRPAAGLSMPQFITLRALAHGPKSASALADIFGVSRPTVTRMVDGLVRKGLVVRHHDLGDRRLAIISLTDDGQALQASSEEAAERFLRDMLEHLAPNQLDRLGAALADLGTLLDQAEAKPPSIKERPE